VDQAERVLAHRPALQQAPPPVACGGYGAKVDVVTHGKVRDQIPVQTILGQHTHAHTVQCGRPCLRDVMPVKDDVAGTRPQQPRQGLCQLALPVPFHAGNADDLTWMNAKADPINDPLTPPALEHQPSHREPCRLVGRQPRLDVD